MSFRLAMSAGEFFDLIRPAVLVFSALLSTWVLASARRRQFPLYISLAWALGTLFFSFIVFPVYLISLIALTARSRGGTLSGAPGELPRAARRATVRWKLTVPFAYALFVLLLTGVYVYRDYESVDAHLVRATQAKVSGDRSRTIDEYRAALKIEDNAHTHKLLARELAETDDLTEALGEFRLAERGGEPDDLIAFRIALLLDALNLPNQAALDYQRFLDTEPCTQPLPDYRCEVARANLQKPR